MCSVIPLFLSPSSCLSRQALTALVFWFLHSFLLFHSYFLSPAARTGAAYAAGQGCAGANYKRRKGIAGNERERGGGQEIEREDG